jgi:hypothetical protein
MPVPDLTFCRRRLRAISACPYILRDDGYMRARRVALVACVAVLCVSSVIVFMFFDGRSHSNSDTIRPFIITMAPAWILFVVVWRLTAKPRR